MTVAIIILAIVTAQRLGELWLSSVNTRRLLAGGGREVGSGHYPLLIGVHVLWLAALWWLAPGEPLSWPLIGIFLVLQLCRLWAIGSLGRRWTTRIIILPEAPLVVRGPYRFLRHPNYVIVSLEIAVLPLVFGLVDVALLFSALNAAVLAVRIRAEEKALAPLR